MYFDRDLKVAFDKLTKVALGAGDYPTALPLLPNGSCMVSIEVLVSKMWMGIWQSRKKTVFQRCGWLSDISRFMVKKSWPFAVLTVGSLPL